MPTEQDLQREIAELKIALEAARKKGDKFDERIQRERDITAALRATNDRLQREHSEMTDKLAEAEKQLRAARGEPEPVVEQKVTAAVGKAKNNNAR